jgi:hypothetical protein
MYRFATMRTGDYGKLRRRNLELIGSAACDEWDCLKRLGRRAQEAPDRHISDGRDQLAIGIDGGDKSAMT